MRLFVNIIFIILEFIPIVLIIIFTIINNKDFSYNKIFKPKIEYIVPHEIITFDLWPLLKKCKLEKNSYITLYNNSNYDILEVPLNVNLSNIPNNSIQMKTGFVLKYLIRNQTSKKRKIELSIYKSNQKKKLCSIVVKKKQNNNLITCFEQKLNDIFCIYISEQNPHGHLTKMNITQFHFDGKQLNIISDDILIVVNYEIKNIQTIKISENIFLLIIYRQNNIIEVYLLNNLYKEENNLYECKKPKNKFINIKEKRKAFNIFEEGHKIYIEGHRGDTTNSHENTILSFKDAIRNGLDSIELDVWLTKDNIPVVSHDLKIKYIKNDNNLTKEKLTINNVTYEYIRQLNENEKEKGKEVPTLEEVLDICKDKIFINIELKDYQYKTTFDIVTQLITKKNMFNQISLSSLRPKYISLIKEFNQNNSIKIECGKIFKPFSKIKNIKKADGCSANVEVNKINEDLIKEAHKNGMPVMVYFINEKDENETIYKKLIDYKVNVICCNNPKNAIKIRDKYYKQNVKYSN